jgi:hypothetical protein
VIYIYIYIYILKFNCHFFLFVCCICAPFWRLPIRGGSQNRDYIKNQYIPQLIEKHMSLYSSVNRGIYEHVARAGVVGRAPILFLGYV